MTTNAAIRKGTMLLGAGGVYVAACYIGYRAVQNNQQDFDETERCTCSTPGFSFVSNPERNKQYQNVAEKYDDEVGRDESVMGINLLRRSLLYFHARGTVLEVGAGTGRNIRKTLHLDPDLCCLEYSLIAKHGIAYANPLSP